MAKTKKLYSVGVYEEQGGFLGVYATSEDEARELAEDYVSENGFDDKIYGTHRNTFISVEPEVARLIDIRTEIINKK